MGESVQLGWGEKYLLKVQKFKLTFFTEKLIQNYVSNFFEIENQVKFERFSHIL